MKLPILYHDVAPFTVFPKINKDYYKNKISDFTNKNKLKYVLFIILDINKNTNEVNIDWKISDSKFNYIKTIETSALSNLGIEKSIIINAEKFAKKLLI